MEFKEYSWNSRKKAELKKSAIFNFNRNMLTTELLSMFKWDGLPDTIPPEFLERILFFNGSAGVSLDDRIAYGGNHSGEVDSYGMGIFYTGATPKKSYNEKIGEKCVVCWNNNMMFPDSYNVIRYADMLTEIEVSMNLALINGRHYPIPVAKDTKQKEAIKESINDMRIGKPVSIVSDNILEELENGSSIMQTISLTDPQQVDKIQYLSRFRDDWIKIFYNQYGQALQTNNKLAQQTSEEIHGEDSVAFIEPYDRLTQRKKFAKELSEKLDMDIRVDFSLPWKIEFEKFQQSRLQEENQGNQMETEKQSEGIEKEGVEDNE